MLVLQRGTEGGSLAVYFVAVMMYLVIAMAASLSSAADLRPVKTICSHPIDLVIDTQTRFAVLEYFNGTFPSVRWQYRFIGRPEDVPQPRTRVEAWLLNGSNCDAYLGPGASLSAVAMNAVMNVPWLDYASTSTELSSKTSYPYFSRVIPADNVGASIMVHSLVRYGWTRVNLFWTQSSYGTSFSQYVFDALRSLPNDIGGVVQSRSVQSSPTNESVDLAIDALLSSSTRVVVVIMIATEDAFNVLKARLQTRGLLHEFIFVMSEAFCSGNTQWLETVDGAFCATYTYNVSLKAPFMQQYSQRDRTIEVAELVALGWPYHLWQAYIDETDFIYATYGVDAVYLVMMLLNRTAAVSEITYTLDEMTSMLHSEVYVGFSGVVELDSKGDRPTAAACMYNVQNRTSVVVGYLDNNSFTDDAIVESVGIRTLGQSIVLQRGSQSGIPSASWPAPPASGNRLVSTTVLIGIICMGVALVFVGLGLYEFSKTEMFRRMSSNGLWMVIAQATVLMGSAGLRCYTGVLLGRREAVPVLLRVLYVLVNGLSVSVNMWEVVELIRWFADVVRSDDDMSERQVRSWQKKLTLVRMVSLAINDFPLVALGFAALLQDDTVTVVVLMSLCVACFNAGTKFDTIKAKLLLLFASAPPRFRRFKTLRAVARYVLLMQRLAKVKGRTWTHTSSAASVSGGLGSGLQSVSVGSSSTKAELLMYRQNVKQLNPARAKYLRKNGKHLHLQLADLLIAPEEYYAFIRPYLDSAFHNDEVVADGANTLNSSFAAVGAASALAAKSSRGGLTPRKNPLKTPRSPGVPTIVLTADPQVDTTSLATGDGDGGKEGISLSLPLQQTISAPVATPNQRCITPSNNGLAIQESCMFVTEVTGFDDDSEDSTDDENE